MFPTVFKRREIGDFIQGKSEVKSGRFDLRRRVREWRSKRVNVTEQYTNTTFIFFFFFMAASGWKIIQVGKIFNALWPLGPVGMFLFVHAGWPRWGAALSPLLSAPGASNGGCDITCRGAEPSPGGQGDKQQINHVTANADRVSGGVSQWARSQSTLWCGVVAVPGGREMYGKSA